MQTTTYITPQRGGMTVGWLTLASIALGSLSLLHVNEIEADEVTNTTRSLVGAAMGLALGGVWLAGAFRSSRRRFATRFLVAAMYTLVASILTQQPWLRHGANIGGLIVAQCIVFFALRIPTWQTRHPESHEPSIGARQFGVGEVLVLTSCVALLLTIGQRYATPIESRLYWSVLILFWIATPILMASIALGSLASRFVRALLSGTCMIALLVGIPLAMSFAESRLGNEETLDMLVPRYAFVILGCAATFSVLAICGRIDASHPVPKSGRENDGTERHE